MREFTPKVTFCHSCKYWAEAVMHNCVDPYGEYFCPYDMVECDENNSKFELMRNSLGEIWAKMYELEIKKNAEAINQLSRNKSVFKFDEEMTKAIDRAIKALEFINVNCPSTFEDFLQERNDGQPF